MAEASEGRSRIDKDVRSIAVYALILLVGAVSWFARTALVDLKTSVEQTGQSVQSAVQTLNQHTTEIAVMDVRLKQLEQKKSGDDRSK